MFGKASFSLLIAALAVQTALSFVDVAREEYDIVAALSNVEADDSAVQEELEAVLADLHLANKQRGADLYETLRFTIESGQQNQLSSIQELTEGFRGAINGLLQKHWEQVKEGEFEAYVAELDAPAKVFLTEATKVDPSYSETEVKTIVERAVEDTIVSHFEAVDKQAVERLMAQITELFAEKKSDMLTLFGTKTRSLIITGFKNILDKAKTDKLTPENQEAVATKLFELYKANTMQLVKDKQGTSEERVALESLTEINEINRVSNYLLFNLKNQYAHNFKNSKGAKTTEESFALVKAFMAQVIDYQLNSELFTEKSARCLAGHTLLHFNGGVESSYDNSDNFKLFLIERYSKHSLRQTLNGDKQRNGKFSMYYLNDLVKALIDTNPAELTTGFSEEEVAKLNIIEQGCYLTKDDLELVKDNLDVFTTDNFAEHEKIHFYPYIFTNRSGDIAEDFPAYNQMYLLLNETRERLSAKEVYAKVAKFKDEVASTETRNAFMIDRLSEVLDQLKAAQIESSSEYSVDVENYYLMLKLMIAINSKHDFVIPKVAQKDVENFINVFSGERYLNIKYFAQTAVQKATNATEKYLEHFNDFTILATDNEKFLNDANSRSNHTGLHHI